MSASRKSARRLSTLRKKNLGLLRRRRTLRLESLEARLALVGDISGTVFNDANSNGLLEPLLGEVGAVSQFVYLDANSNGAFDTGEPSTLTSGTGTYTFPALADGSYRVRLLLDPVTDETVPTVHSGPNLFAALPNIVDHVFDATTGIDYATTSAGNVERFDTRVGKLLTPFKVGVSPGGLDITPDGQFLYVAEQQPGTTQSFVRKVNTLTGDVTNLGFNRIGAESGSFDVTILNNGKAFFTTQQVGGVRGNLREITLATDAISLRGGLVGASDIAPFTRLNRNSDRSAVVFTEPDAVGNVFFYKTATDTFTARTPINTSLALAPAAISRDGSRAAVSTPAGVRIVNTTTGSVVQTVTPVQRGGLVFDPLRDILYVGNDTTDNIVPYSYTPADVFTAQATIAIGENIVGTARYFQLNIAPNGKLLTLGTGTGVRSYALYSQTSRLVNIAGSNVANIDFGVHNFANVQATGTRDYYVMSNAATTLTVTVANGLIPNDRDPNLTQSLTALLVRQATKGLVSLNPDGSFVYSTSPVMDLKDTFEYVINDGVVDSAPITATIARISNKGSSISGREYLDTNLDGAYQVGETPIAGARVYLDLNNNGFLDPLSDPFLLTAADGTYTFIDLPAATYHVRTETPTGDRPTWPVAPVNFGSLLPVSGVKDFAVDEFKQVLYVALASGDILRYSFLTNQFLSPLKINGVPAALDIFLGYLFVADSQEVADRTFVHRIDTANGAVTTIALDTPGAETGAFDIAVASAQSVFVTTSRSGAGFNPLHEIQNLYSATPTTTIRNVPVGSGVGGTITGSTRLTTPQFQGNVLFQEAGASGHIFQYNLIGDQFIDGPATQASSAGTQSAIGAARGLLKFASNQFGPSLFDDTYRATEIFSNTFNAGVAFRFLTPLLYAADGGPDVLIGYHTETGKELFRVQVGEDLATAPLKQIVVSPDNSKLFVGTPSGIRIFDIGLPGNNDVVLGEDQSIGNVDFGQAPIESRLQLDVPGGVMNENQGTAALTGILTRRGPDLSQNVFVNLIAADPGRVGVPITVLIPAGQSSVTFPIDAIDNNVLDVNSNVTIYAYGGAAGNANDFVTINDQETLDVTIALATIPEVGGSTTATVTRSNAGTSNVSEAFAGAFDNTTGVFYTLLNGFSGNARLATVDTSTGAVTPIGSGTGTNMICLEVAADGTIYGVGYNDGILRTINKTTGVATAVGPTGINLVMDLAFKSDGTLYATVENNLYTINTSTAASSLVGSMSGVAHHVMGIAFDGSDVLYATDYVTNGPLYTVNTTTLAATVVGPTGFNFPHGGDILASASPPVFYSTHSDGTRFGAINTTTGVGTDLNNVPALVVALLSSDTSEATVPATVTIPAGQSTVSFTITAVDDLIYDGTRPVVISAAAAGYVSLSASVGIVSDLDSYRNILVSTVPSLHNSRLRTYSPAGALLSDFGIPTGPGGDEPVRDLIVNAAQNVEFFNGTNDPTLSTLDPRRGTYTHRTTDGWSTASDSSYGGLATLGNYIFATDMATGTGADLQQGLIRFDITDYSSTRFATTKDFIDVAAGLDGLIYGMEFTPVPLPAVPTPPFNVQVYNPTTMAFIRTVALASPELPLAIAVNAQGQIFAVNGDNLIYEFAANGVLVRTLSTAGTQLNELDISPEGQLIAGGATGSVVVMNDPGHDLPTSFVVGSTQAFVAFGNLNRADGLTLSVAPTTFSEAAGPAASAATVTRPSLADLSASLVVTLASSDPSEADVQQTVTIPAGQATATFNILAIDDLLGDFTQNVTLTALAPGQVGASANLTVLDDEIDYFTVSITPASMPEVGGTATGTVTRFVLDNSLPLVVSLSSNDTTEATVPATVTILANQNSATFSITAVDDLLRDATQNPVITASAAGMSDGTASIGVTDNEIDNITLGIAPGAISENGGSATGTVTRFVGDFTVPMVVNLSSSDTTEATVPASVTILAGQSSSTFTVNGINDAARDFNQAVNVNASAAGVASATAGLTVIDDELDVLAFSFASDFMMENGGSISATVTRTVFDNSLPQVVNLSSSDLTEATVPATVTILGGQNTVTFSITAVDDLIALLDGPQTVTITATAASFSSASRDITVGDNERPYQNQRNVLDVDDSGGVFALDALKVINIINNIGTGDAATIMASYAGPTIFPDTTGDNFITPNDVLLVINYLNIPPPPSGEAEGEGETAPILSPAAFAASPGAVSTSSADIPASPQPIVHGLADAAVLAIVNEHNLPGSHDDAPRGKHRCSEWDELVGDLAAELVKRRRN